MKIKVLGHIIHDNETFKAGDKLTLTKAEGDRLIRLGKAKELTKKLDIKQPDTSNKDEDTRTLEELQEEAKAFGIDITDMTRTMLIEEMKDF